MARAKTTQARGMGRIIHNANGSWTLRYWANVDGKSGQVEKTFATKAAAVDKQAEVWQKKRAGEVFTSKSRGEVPFLDVAAAWIERSPDRGESTRAVYRSTLKHLHPLAGKTLVWVAKNPAAVQALITSLPSSYKKRAKVLIAGCLNTAVDDGDIEGHRINRRNVKAGRETPVKKAPDFTLYPDIDALVEKLAVEIGPRYALTVWTGRYAGLRVGESLGLNRSDIITRNGKKYLKVQRQRGSDGSITGTTKTDSSTREIPVGDRLQAFLDDAPADDDGWFFPPQFRRTYYDRYNKARDAAGLPSWFTPHTLRHLWASTCLSEGVRLDIVSKLLGHTNVKLTAAVYAHPTTDDEDMLRGLL